MKDNSVRKGARVRSGGYRALLLLAVTRSRHDQIDATKNHRAGNGLAVSERTQV